MYRVEDVACVYVNGYIWLTVGLENMLSLGK